MAIVFSSKISDSTNEYTISNYYTGMSLSSILVNRPTPLRFTNIRVLYFYPSLYSYSIANPMSCGLADEQDTRYSGED